MSNRHVNIEPSIITFFCLGFSFGIQIEMSNSSASSCNLSLSRNWCYIKRDSNDKWHIYPRIETFLKRGLVTRVLIQTTRRWIPINTHQSLPLLHLYRHTKDMSVVIFKFNLTDVSKNEPTKSHFCGTVFLEIFYHSYKGRMGSNRSGYNSGRSFSVLNNIATYNFCSLKYISKWTSYDVLHYQNQKSKTNDLISLGYLCK